MTKLNAKNLKGVAEGIVAQLETDKRVAFAPSVSEGAGGIVWQLSAVIEGEPGHHPLPPVLCADKDRKFVEEVATLLNEALDLKDRDVVVIVASTMGKVRRGRPTRGTDQG